MSMTHKHQQAQLDSSYTTKLGRILLDSSYKRKIPAFEQTDQQGSYEISLEAKYDKSSKVENLILK